MSRKIKYNIDFKKSVVERVINGKSCCKSIALSVLIVNVYIRGKIYEHKVNWFKNDSWKNRKQYNIPNFISCTLN